MNRKPQQLSIFSIPKTQESPVLVDTKIIRVAEDFVSKNNFRKSVKLSKSSNDFEKNYIVFL